MEKGKMERLGALADSEGRLRMMGIGAVETLKKMLARQLGVTLDAVTGEQISSFKETVARSLAGYFSAVSVDPVYGYPSCARHIRGTAGLILSVQASSYELIGLRKKERRVRFLEVWKDRSIETCGADAIKLTVYHRKDNSPEVKDHCKEMAAETGAWCCKRGIPFILEVMSYPLTEDEESDPLVYARSLPDIVLGNVEEFSNPRYRADVLKIDFPADLKACRNYTGEFDAGTAGFSPVYDLREVESFCKAVSRASPVPWIILSGGTVAEEFVERVKIAAGCGASGFLGGRPLWNGAVIRYPDAGAMEEWLRTEGVQNARKLEAASRAALPYFEAMKTR
jgi:tagatose 1,6-diphosphate aldolase